MPNTSHDSVSHDSDRANVITLIFTRCLCATVVDFKLSTMTSRKVGVVVATCATSFANAHQASALEFETSPSDLAGEAVRIEFTTRRDRRKHLNIGNRSIASEQRGRDYIS
ncbi:hypothetical protein MRB53_039174 [Persea americana]|nr:hypothetical protein MRB53_039174 [Persea americana]